MQIDLEIKLFILSAYIIPSVKKHITFNPVSNLLSDTEHSNWWP